MYKQVWCTCKVVVLLIKPIVFLTFSLPSASLDLKVPNSYDLLSNLTQHNAYNKHIRNQQQNTKALVVIVCIHVSSHII